MTRYFISLLFLLIIFQSKSIYALTPYILTKKFSLGLTTLIGYSTNHEINDFIDGYGSNYANDINAIAVANSITADFKGEDTKSNLVAGITLDMRFFSRNWGAGVSGGFYATAPVESKVSSETWVDKSNLKLEFAYIPFYINLLYRLAFNDEYGLIFGFGVGFGKALARYEWHDDVSISSTYGESLQKIYSNIFMVYQGFMEWIIQSRPDILVSIGLKATYGSVANLANEGLVLRNYNGDSFSISVKAIYTYLSVSYLIF